MQCVLYQLVMFSAIVDRNSIEFARGIAEILLWSAEHARVAAEADGAGSELAEWQCAACGESVPGNFDLCWNCETVRGKEGDCNSDENETARDARCESPEWGGIR